MQSEHWDLKASITQKLDSVHFIGEISNIVTIFYKINNVFNCFQHIVQDMGDRNGRNCEKNKKRVESRLAFHPKKTGAEECYFASETEKKYRSAEGSRAETAP